MLLIFRVIRVAVQSFRVACPGLNKNVSLHATLFRGTAPVVGQRRHVFDPQDLQTGVLNLQDRLLATRAGYGPAAVECRGVMWNRTGEPTIADTLTRRG